VEETRRSVLFIARIVELNGEAADACVLRCSSFSVLR
jgi:hypothetical protein